MIFYSFIYMLFVEIGGMVGAEGWMDMLVGEWCGDILLDRISSL